jgi:hypothetical protein
MFLQVILKPGGFHIRNGSAISCQSVACIDKLVSRVLLVIMQATLQEEEDILIYNYQTTYTGKVNILLASCNGNCPLMIDQRLF